MGYGEFHLTRRELRLLVPGSAFFTAATGFMILVQVMAWREEHNLVLALAGAAMSLVFMYVNGIV